MHNDQLLAIRALIGRIPDAGPTERVTAVLSSIEKDASAILELIQNPDPMKSSVAIDLLINQEKAGLRKKIDAARAELIPLIERWRTVGEANRVKAAALIPDAYAQETRGVFRQMSTPAQLVFMADATKAGDGATAAAILNCPPILSGLTAEQQTKFRDAFLDHAAGPGVGETVDSMLSVVTTALDAAARIGAPIGAAPRPTSPSGATA